MSDFRLRTPTRLALALAVLAMGASSPIARAEPRIDLSWDDCSPIVMAKSSLAKDHSATLFVSATGLTEVHDEFIVRLWFGTEMHCDAMNTTTPDAWRFDAEGCQTEALIQLLYATPSKSCPPLAPANALTLSSLRHAPIQFDNRTPPGAMKLTVIRNYNGVPQTPDPGTRYLLVAARFDHTYSTAGAGTPGLTCGGLDTPVCFSLWPDVGDIGPVGSNCNWFFEPLSSLYRSSDMTTIPLPPGQAYATFNVSGGFSCFEAVPAHATTWGQIKGRYR